MPEQSRSDSQPRVQRAHSQRAAPVQSASSLHSTNQFEFVPRVCDDFGSEHATKTTGASQSPHQAARSADTTTEDALLIVRPRHTLPEVERDLDLLRVRDRLRLVVGLHGDPKLVHVGAHAFEQA